MISPMLSNPSCPDIKHYIIPGKDGDLAVILLDRPQAYNAINLAMLMTIKTLLLAWQNDDRIKGVILSATGDKAFCAGGDIKALLAAKQQHITEAANILYHAYRLNYYISQYPKPIISFCFGLTLGGGVGAMAHTRFRVCAPDIAWAMPEANIGFFPDVGSHYFMPQYFGHNLSRLLMLMSARLSAADLVHFNMIQAVVEKSKWPQLFEALAQKTWSSPDEDISAVLDDWHTLTTESGWAKQTQDWQPLAEASLVQLFSMNTHHLNAHWQQRLDQLQHNSPTSLLLIDLYCQQYKNPDLKTALNTEFQIAQFCLTQPDFEIGVLNALNKKCHPVAWRPYSVALDDLKKMQALFAQCLSTINPLNLV